MTQFRSRKGGQAYPIRQGAIPPHRRPRRTLSFTKSQQPPETTKKVDKVLNQTGGREVVVTVKKGGETTTEVKK